MSAPGKRTAAVVLAVALLAGAGLYINARLRAPAVDHAIALVPADARAYLHVFIKPSTSQRRALQDLLERFPQTNEDDEARTFVNDLLRESLARFDIAVDEDATDWLGDEAAAYVAAGASAPVVLLALDDEETARRELEVALSKRLDGLTLEFVDGFVAIGERGAVHLANEDDSLGDVASYNEMIDTLGKHRIATFFASDVDASPILAVLRATRTGVVIDAIADSEIEPFDDLSGYVVASLAGLRGRVTFTVPAPLRPATGVVDRIRNVLPELVADHRGPTLMMSIGEADPEGGARLLRAAQARLGSDFEPAFVADAAALPAVARRPFLTGVDEAFTPVLEQFLTLDLGVREVGPYTLGRLVITFSDA